MARRLEVVAGHTVEVMGSFDPIYILSLEEWGEGYPLSAAQTLDKGGLLLAAIQEPVDRAANNDNWDFGEEERFQTVVKEVLRGLDYGERKVGKMEVYVDDEWKEIPA